MRESGEDGRSVRSKDTKQKLEKKNSQKKNFKKTQKKKLSLKTGWLKFLRTSIGFDGWRFDYVKGYSGEFARTYIDATVPDMAFGEYWVRRRKRKIEGET